MKNKFLLVCSYLERDNDYLYFIDPAVLENLLLDGEIKKGDIITVTSRTRGASLMKVEFIINLEEVGKSVEILFKRHDFYGGYYRYDNVGSREYDVYLLKINLGTNVIYREVRRTIPMNRCVSFVKHDLHDLINAKYAELGEITEKKEVLKEQVDDAIRSDDVSLKEFKEKYRAVLDEIKAKQEEIGVLEKEVANEAPFTSEEFENFFNEIEEKAKKEN